MSVTVIYDGDCPFCLRYVRLLRLREGAGDLKLLNAREHPALARQLRDQGFPLDDGMVVRIAGRTYHGADALHVLAMLSTPSDFFNRVSGFIFRSRILSGLIYPVLRLGRSVTLAIMGIKKIGSGNLD